MLQLRDIEKEYGGRRLLDRVSWHVQPGARIGLCGANGSGKTTLLRLLSGQIESDAGSVQVARGTTFGYLPQDGLTHAGQSLFAEVRSGFAELTAIEAELGQLETLVEAGADEKTLSRYAELQEIFQLRGGLTIDAGTSRVLKGLGFAESDFDRPCEEFSGGWQMRIALARLLVGQPTLLLLDEPTNHLDLPARDWLEAYLRAYPFGVILVSHDRWFLESVVDQIVEVWNGGLTEYPGNYSRYETERDRRVTALHEAKDRQDKEVARVQAFIDRFRFQASKASQVQSRVKALEKVVPIDVPPRRKRIVFRFPDPPPSGQAVLSLEDVEHGYGALSVLAGIGVQLRKGERVALVGANGAGKSTLMRVLSGTELPRAGRRVADERLKVAYFAQDQAKELPADRTALEAITEAAPLSVSGRVRDILGAFLFHGDDVRKPVSVLSGGERHRLALAILLLRPANLLLLDEPTNHLDLASKDVLLESLDAYTGTMVFVSHDRYFVDGLATRVLEVGDGKVTSYPGNYGDFLRARAAAADGGHQTLRVERTQVAATPTAAATAPPEGKLAYKERKEAQRAERAREREIAAAEARAATLEAKLAALEAKLADAAVYGVPQRLHAATVQYEALRAQVAAAWDAWEAVESAADRPPA